MICLTGRNDISASFLSRLCFHELNIESDGHFVADENAASLECSVPGQAEVFAVDLGRRRNRHTGVAPGILHRWCWAFNCKRCLASNAADGEVALDLEFAIADNLDIGGLERQGRKLLDVQEVCAFQVRVALGFAGFYRSCLD